MDIKNDGSAYRRIKGFTLVELIIVIAIIAILAGIMNLATQGYIRSAKLETLNDKAQMVYMAFQDILIDCELKQDKSIFEGHSGESTNDITGAVVFFRVSNTDASGHKNKNGLTGVGDEIHVMCMHKNSVTNGGLSGIGGLCSRSFWIDGTTNPGANSGSGANDSPATSEFGAKGAKRWEKFNKYISGRMDSSMSGTYVVALDLENYQVLSVICRDLVDGQDPKTGLYSSWEVVNGQPALNSYINGFTSATSVDSGGTVNFPVMTFFVKNGDHQREILKRSGVGVGSYPYGDSLYTDITVPQ